MHFSAFRLHMSNKQLKKIKKIKVTAHFNICDSVLSVIENALTVQCGYIFHLFHFDFS